MKLAIISPIEHLHQLSTLGDFQFALAHIEDKAYRGFYRVMADRGNYVMLDNGSYELGNAVEDSKIWDAVEAINPNEIVAPDVQWDPVASYKSQRKFLKYVEEEGLRDKYVYSVVVWANDPISFEAWYLEYLKLKPDVIGVGKWLTTKYLARTWVLERLEANHMMNPQVQYHALGCGYPGEMRRLANCGLVRSIDTSGPIADAMNGIKYEPGRSYIELIESSLKRSLDFNAKLTDEQIEIALHNCKLMLKDAKRSVMIDSNNV